MAVDRKDNHSGVRLLSEGTDESTDDEIKPLRSPRIELTTLGASELRVRDPDGAVRALLGPGKPLGLISYVALIPSRSATRDHLLDLFWSDLEPEGGRHALRQTLWYLKRRLGVTLLSSTDDTIALAQPVDIDRDTFLAAVESDRLERAVELYAGEFLPDFALPGGAEFEHWADLERERLRATFVRTAERLTRVLLSVPRHREAVALARRTRDIAPNAEFTWRLLLEALISARDQVGALVEADALERRLAEEHTEPDPATRALLRAARSQREQPERESRPGAIPLVPELVGREAEFAQLLGAWNETRDGRARHIHLSGRAGIGKSRLLGDFEARLRGRRARIASVRARPGDRMIPFALLAEVAGALSELSGANGVAPEVASTLVTLNPRLSSVFSAKPAQAREADLVRVRSLALSELIASVTEDGSVALIVDDIHWADEDSQRALVSALGRHSTDRLLTVTAGRPGLMPGLDLSTAHEIALAPLSSAHVGALVASLGTVPDGLPGEELAKRIQGATHGSPLLILELLGALIERGTVALERGEWRVNDQDALTEAIMSGSAIYHRLASLPAWEQRVILTAALAGVPLDAETYSLAADVGASTLEPLLNDLERRGIMARTSSGWQPAHDEIAEAIADLGAPEARADVHRRLGRAFSSLRVQPVQLMRAARHYAMANDDDGVDAVFKEWLATGRARNDRRGAVRLAAEFLGEDPSSDHARLLAARAPFFVRHRPNLWHAAAAAVLLLTTVVLSMRPAGPAPARPEIELVARMVEGGKTRFSRLALRREDFNRADQIDLQSFGVPTDSTAYVVSGVSGVSSDGRVATARSMPDSGGLDLFVSDRAGATERITFQPGDDVQPSWSPDGRLLAFSSARWDSLSHYDLAVLDVSTLAVRQLTRGPHSDGTPHWSPDGTLISFSRRSWDESPGELCFVTPAGAVPSCVRDPDGGETSALGWFDARRLVVLTIWTTRHESALRIYDVDDSAFVTLRKYASADAELSPDGKWVSCRCAEAGQRERTRVWAVESPTIEREIRVGPVSDASLELHWRGPLPHAPYLSSLSIDAPLVGIPLNAAYRLSVRGLDQHGAPIDVRHLVWSSPDSTVAFVTREGLIVPKRPGRIHVAATAGGWRSATAEIEVVEAASLPVLSMDWKRPLARTFVPFGDPAPAVVDDQRFGRAFWNNGDGSFTSGVYSRDAFGASNGLGVEAWVSVPATITQWQVAELTLTAGLDTDALTRWDHRSGALPLLPSPERRWCSATAPSGEGPEYRDKALAFAPADQADFPVPALGTGRWIRMRVQLFPDGRCGVAIDGVPKAIVWNSRDFSQPYRLLINGNSFRTRVLVGPVDMWRGVRGDVDWRALDRNLR